MELGEWTIGIYGLRIGIDLDDQTVEKIKSTDAEAQAKNIAINYLSYRPRSSKEVIDHLMKKGSTRPCAEKVARILQSATMIDDVGFARVFIRDRLKRKPMGRTLLRMQLLAKGIPSDSADTILAEFISPQSQQSAALQAARQKTRLKRTHMKKTDADKQKKRLIDFLLRRGFPYEIVMKTVRTILDH